MYRFMMRRALAGLVLGVVARSAAAQPGETPSGAPPSGSPTAPPPYTYRPQVVLTEEERDIVETGEIKDIQVIAGGLTGLVFGFGTGQAVEGRWHDTGWIFTFGEVVSLGTFIVGAIRSICIDYEHDFQSECHNSNTDGALVLAGLIGFAGFRIGEIVDVFTGPARYNDRLRAIRRRLGYPDHVVRVTPYLSAPRGGDGGVAGFALRF